MDSTLTLALFKSRQVQAKSLAELVSLIKANPGKFNFSSSGKGGAPHLAGELFRMAANLDMVHVPYNGAGSSTTLSMRNSLMQLVQDAGFRAEAARDGPALTDVAAGQVQLTFTTFTSAQALLAAKRVDAVVVANRKRLAVMPDVPTFEEAGIKGMEIGTMNGLLVPAGTPPAVVVARIYAALAKAGQNPEFRKQFVDQGGEVLLDSPAVFTTYIREDLNRWKTLIPKIGGIQ